jgi:hypothetical protein
MVTRFQVIPAGQEAAFEAAQAAPAGPEAVQPMSRVYGERLSYTVPIHGQVGQSVLETVSQRGNAQTVELIPGNPASRTLVDVAIRENLLRRGPGGVLEEVKGNQGQSQNLADKDAAAAERQKLEQHAAELTQAEALEGVFSETEDAQWREAFSDVPEYAMTATGSRIVNALMLGSDFEGVYKGLVQDTGMEPAKAAEAVELAFSLQTAIVHRAVAKVGVTEQHRDAFFESLRDQPNHLGNALQRLIHTRDVGPFQQLARQWAIGQGINTKGAI